MKSILLIIICVAFVVPCLAQNELLVRSKNKVSGTVLDEKSQPLPRIRVCLYSAQRPQQGRAPCGMTNEQGKFDFTADVIIGEKYAISASTQWALVRNGKFPQKYQEIWSEPIIFENGDESKEINLQFNGGGKCSSVTEGLKLCADSDSFAFKAGEKVSIKFTLYNLTDQELTTYDRRIKYDENAFDNNQAYSYIVTDPNGKRLPTKLEELTQQVSAGIVPRSELLKQLPIYSGPGYTTIRPHQNLPGEINLSQYYDFKIKGRYSVGIKLKIPRKSRKELVEIRLQKIELNIN